MITLMSKVEIFFLKEDTDRAISCLHTLGMLHIEQVPLTKIMEQRNISRISLSPEEEKEKLSCESLIKETDEVIKKLPLSPAGGGMGVGDLETKATRELTEIVTSRIKPQFNTINREISMLKDELRILPLNETIQCVEERLKQIPPELEGLNKRLLEFARESIPLICAIKTIASNRLEDVMAVNNLLVTRYTAVVTGWLPTRNLDHLREGLEGALGKNFAVYDCTRFIKQKEEIPVLLENPKGIKPFELLLGLLPLPRYGTRDATGLMSIFFPIFFGLIVGDIGYGLIFLIISLFLKRSARYIVKSIGSILFKVSISTIFFGFLFGEFLGNLGKEYLKLPHILFDRHESIIPFLILAISVGVFHIVLGFILGIIEAFRRRHKKEIIEKLSILGGLAGLFLLVGSMVNILPGGFLPPSIVILAVITILLIIVKGFIGPLEAISTVANILSYARLMALGLAGVMMAGIANHLGGLPENIFVGIIIASLLHALNLVLSVFSPTIQSLRLHYVEFFSKFYEPGGKKYNPFRKKEVAECIS